MLSQGQVEDLRRPGYRPYCKECDGEVMWVETVVMKWRVMVGAPIEYDNDAGDTEVRGRLVCSHNSIHETGWDLVCADDVDGGEIKVVALRQW